MAFLSTQNVAVRGICAGVPLRVEENRGSSVFATGEDADKFIVSTGVERRRHCFKEQTTLDLCHVAADRLISDLKWNRDEIDCLIFVTQTPDYYLPANSCIVQQRLGLSEECYTLDISLGCSGWVYGMSVITALIQSGTMRKGLLLAGDTALKTNSVEDKSAWPLFGDAGTATAFEYDPKASPITYHLASDGSGWDAIVIPDGGFRNPVSAKSFEMIEIEDGIKRNNLHTVLNGMDVFSFGITKAPQSVNKLLERIGTDRGQIDYFVFHQANLFMNEKIRKKLKLTPEQVPYSLRNFGNTSSATIPLTMATELDDRLKNEKLSLVCCGFGVGLSWATVAFETECICVPSMVEI